VHINKEIKIHKKNNKKENAIFKDVDNFGNALIETTSGLEVFSSGQIIIKGIY
jgi:biotin-(acetyl-CoA carboxylase) ligase